jgi:protein arginine kinase activator
MKCENCGKNEVTFVYRSNINGEITEKHLCKACAEKLGYSRRIAAHNQQMMQNFFGGSLFGDSFMNDFFSPMPSLFGRMGRMLEDPFDDFFAEMPALRAVPAPQEAAEEEKKDDLVGKEEQKHFAYLRQMNALKMEMKKAVHQENFERAAELRDQIKALEAEHKEQKEGK